MGRRMHSNIFRPGFFFLLCFVNARLRAKGNKTKERVGNKYFFFSPVTVQCPVSFLILAGIKESKGSQQPPV